MKKLMTEWRQYLKEEEVQKAIKEVNPVPTPGSVQEKSQVKCPAGCMSVPARDEDFYLDYHDTIGDPKRPKRDLPGPSDPAFSVDDLLDEPLPVARARRGGRPHIPLMR